MSTPTKTPTQLPTAPLPPAASAALHRLERPFLPLEIVRAVTRYEVATECRDRLSQRRATTWTAAEFQAFFDCGPIFEESLRVLEAAGRMDLIAPARTASDYRTAEARANELIWSALTTGIMSDLHADDLAHYVDLMAGHKATLADAGRLDLIGGA